MPLGYTPIYRIEHNGVDITGRFNDRATSVQVELTSGDGASDTFSITMDDRDWAIARPQVNQILRIHMGYKEVGLANLGLYEINEVNFEGPPRSIRITGTSAGMNTVLKSQTYKEFENKTVGEIISHIAGKAGLIPSITGMLASKKYEYKNQAGISDYHLLVDMGRHFDAVAKVANGMLIFAERDSPWASEGSLAASAHLTPEHFGTWSVKHTERSAYSEVKAAYHDKPEHKTKWETVPVPGINMENLPFRLNRVYNNQTDAKTAATSKAAQLNRARGQVRAELAKGNPWIREQMILTISGMRDGINGRFVIDTIKHTFTKDQGIMTQLFALDPDDTNELEGILNDNADALRNAAQIFDGVIGGVDAVPSVVQTTDAATNFDNAVGGIE